MQVSLRPVELQRQDSSSIVVTRGLKAGELVVTAGVHALRPGQKVRLLGSRTMTRFNLSAWAITPSFDRLLPDAGAARPRHRLLLPTWAATRIPLSPSRPWWCRHNGRAQHLTTRCNQVTERLERKLQETPHLDYLKSYTKAGESTVFVYLKGSTRPKAVADTWYQVRKKVHDIQLTLPQGVIGPVANDEFGDTYGIIYGFTADGFTNRELRDYVEEIRSRLLQVPDVSKVDLIGAQPERIYIEFSPEKLAGYGLTPEALTLALQAQNVVVPSGRDHHRQGRHQTAGQRRAEIRERHPRHQFRCGQAHHPPGRHRSGAARGCRSAGPDLPHQRQARPGSSRFPCATAVTS